MEDLLIEILSEFGYPVRLQGSLAEDEPYPDHFFTFWNPYSDGSGYYDNEESQVVYDYDVNFYSIDPAKVYEVLREAKKKLKAHGFIVPGDAHSIASDESTHDGRGMTVQYLKQGGL